MGFRYTDGKGNPAVGTVTVSKRLVDGKASFDLPHPDPD